MPHDLDAERGLLGSMLIAPQEVMSDTVARITAAAFYWPAHRVIFTLLADFWDQQRPADLITLTQALRERKQLDVVGGAAYVTSLIDFTPTAANAAYYLDIIKEKHALRQIIITCIKCSELAYSDSTGSFTEASERMQQLLTGLAREASTGSSAFWMSDLIPAAVERLEARHEGRGKLRGIPSGLGLLDRLTGGWQPGQMIVVAAREKEGKSSLARQFVLEAAVAREVPTAIFSHEMGRAEITDALIATRARVDSRRMEEGTMAEQDFPAIIKATKELAKAPICVFDEADSSVLQFRANARRAVQEFGCKLIVLDYLQLVNGTGDEDRREQEVAAVSRNAKLAAKELGIPIIVLSQLNSKGATRESMAIQQDLDRLIVIEHEKPDAEGDSPAWIKVKLSRGGPKGSVPVMWRPSITRFDPLAPDDAPTRLKDL